MTDSNGIRTLKRVIAEEEDRIAQLEMHRNIRQLRERRKSLEIEISGAEPVSTSKANCPQLRSCASQS
jgi:hypothetical protein